MTRMDNDEETATTTTASVVRPSLARSEHGAGQDDKPQSGGNKRREDDEDDLFVMTAHDIANNLEEVNVQHALQKLQQQQQQKEESHHHKKQQHEYWIHVQIINTPNSLSAGNDLVKALPALDAQLWQPLQLSPFLQRLLRDPAQWQTPQVVPVHDAAWIVMRVMGNPPRSSSSSSSPTTAGGDASSIRHVAAICMPHVLITVTMAHERDGKSGNKQTTMTTTNHDASNHHKHLSLWQDPRVAHYHRDESLSRMTQERELPQASVTGCLVLWLGYHIGRTQALASALRNRVYQLVQRDDATDILALHDDIAMAKDTMLRLGAVAEEQNEGIQAVMEGDAVTAGWTLTSTSSSHDAHANLLSGALRVVNQAAAATERMLQRLEKRVADLEHAYDAAQQNTINRRLQALTILSAVFLPLTLMAGVWGMNFSHMPELQRPHAYYYALSSMAAVALSLLAFFYRNGWLN